MNEKRITELLPTPEPSTLPRGIGAMTASFALLVLVDALTSLTLLGHFYSRRAVTVLFPGGLPSALRFEYIFYLPYGFGAILGLVLTFGLLLFGLALLDGRVPVAVAGFRMISWGIVVLHPILVVMVLISVHAVAPALSWLSSPAIIFVGATTPLLYFIVRPLLTMRWLDLRASPEKWEKLRGIDGTGQATTDQRGGERSSLALTLLLTPYASWRAKAYGRTILSGALYLLALASIFVAPFTALIAVAANLVIARTLLITEAPPLNATLSPQDRSALLRRIFTPERLAPPPRFLAAGIIGVLILTPLDLEAACYAANIGGISNVHAFLAMPQLWFALLPFVSIPLAVPTGFLLPLGNPLAIQWYRIVGCLLVLLHGALLLFFWQLLNAPFGPPPPGAAPMLQPVGIVLLALTPLAAAILASLPGAGRISDVRKMSRQ